MHKDQINNCQIDIMQLPRMFLPCLVVLVFLFLNFAIAEGVFETLATAELPADVMENTRERFSKIPINTFLMLSIKDYKWQPVDSGTP